jgi:hypothetical protein
MTSARGAPAVGFGDRGRRRQRRQNRDEDDADPAQRVTVSSRLEAYVVCMDEARRVFERLRRIDALREARANPAVVLREVRALLAEGEAWLALERPGSAEETVAATACASTTVRSPTAPDQTVTGAKRSATGTMGAVASAGDEPVALEGRAEEALAQLDRALASRAAAAGGEEVIREGSAL